MKHILMIATGGTIACRESGRGLAPSLTGEQLIEFLPEIKKICRVFVDNPFSVDSTDMTTEQRKQIATLIWQNYDRYDGFVVAHGTDTLAYTAALLYHMLRNFSKPVIITGSQKPIGVEDSDAERNLLDSFRVACEGWSGVACVLHGQVIRGNHVFKAHTESMSPFKSINAHIVGKVDEKGNVNLNIPPILGGEPEFVEAEHKKIIVLPIIPDLEPDIFDFLKNYDHIILRAYGAGGLPIKLEKVVQKLVMHGKKVYIASQCTEGSVDLHKYEVGRRAEEIGALSLGHRTIEDAIASIQCGII